MSPRLFVTGVIVALAAAVPLGAQTPRPAAPYTVITADGRRAIAAAAVGDQDMLRLDDIAAVLQLAVREDRAANVLTVGRGTAVVVLSLDQPLASMGGKVISLPFQPVRDGSHWLVPPDAVSRAFGAVAGVRVEVRKASRLILVGDVADAVPPLQQPPQQPPPGLSRAQAQPQTANPLAAPAPEPPPVLPPAASPGIRTIVIDPGHGGDELGTQGPSGLLEKDVVLDVARRLKSVVEGRLGIRVLLTRDEDRLVPHDERASIANNNKADLFISLHANSSPNKTVKGAEVFYLSLDGLSDEAKRLAGNPETRPVPVLGGGSRDIDLILWDMAQARHLAESSAFAVTVEEELRRRVEMSPNPVQQAPFRVLVAANMPAVLVELAFLSNPEEERLLATDEFKNKIVQALYDAILRYRSRVEAQAAGRRP